MVTMLLLTMKTILFELIF